jgi:RNA polymerase sigma-70 factor (ECF subfamily)
MVPGELEESRREDAALVAEILARSSGDEPCRRLVAKYWRLLIAWIRHRVKDASEAEDVAQETFIRAFRALDRLADPDRFLPWLLRIAANRATDLARKRRNDQSLDRLLEDGELPPHLSSPQEDPGRQIDIEEECRLVWRAVERLPEKYRLVMMLRYLEGLSGIEIAAALGEPEGTIRNRLFRAHEKIRRLLGPLSFRAEELGRKGEGR